MRRGVCKCNVFLHILSEKKSHIAMGRGAWYNEGQERKCLPK